VPKLSVYFEAFLSRSHGKLEEQNKILGSSIIIIIIINYCIINVCYILLLMPIIIIIFIIKASSRNAIRKKLWQYLGLLLISVSKEDYKRFCAMSYSQSHRQAGIPMINIQTHFAPLPVCVKMFHYSVIW